MSAIVDDMDRELEDIEVSDSEAAWLEKDIYPGKLVDQAAEEVADLLVEMLADDDLPVEVAKDLEARLRTLRHRFPTVE